MQSVKKIEFTAEITRETTMSPVLENLGKANCSMEFFAEHNGGIVATGRGSIEWIVEYLGTDGKPNGDEDVEYIGVWWDAKVLIDYDGVFTLPDEAIKLLRECGIKVPKDFED